MPRRRQKRRQQQDASRNSLSPRTVIRIRNAVALDTRNRSLREAIAELERETSVDCPKDASTEPAHPTHDAAMTTPSVPNTRLICPGLKPSLAKKLAELGSFSMSGPNNVTLSKAVEAIDFILNRIEEVESECTLDGANNVLDEFERLTALQHWLVREIADVTKRHRYLTSLVVELWKAFGDRAEDERAHAKFISQVLYPYFAERVKTANTLNNELAEKVESLRANGDEVRRLRCEREDFDQETSELQDALTHMEVKLFDETWLRQNWQHEWEESNNETRRAWTQLRDANDKVLTLEEQLERFLTKSDNEKKKLKDRYLEMVRKRDVQIVHLQRQLEEAAKERGVLQERHEKEISSNRRENERLHAELAEADGEKRTMEQTMDRLSSEHDRDREELLTENHRLVEELTNERRKTEELATQLQLGIKETCS